jgi:hypothetical protein
MKDSAFNKNQVVAPLGQQHPEQQLMICFILEPKDEASI